MLIMNPAISNPYHKTHYVQFSTDSFSNAPSAWEINNLCQGKVNINWLCVLLKL